MAQDTIIKALGLVTQYNPLSVQSGCLIQADDCVIRRENVIESRRGYNSYGTLANEPAQLFSYLRRVIAHHSTTLSYDNGSGTFADYSGSYSAPSGYKMRAIETVSNCYVTTSLGVQVLTDIAGTAARKAGSPRSLDPSYALNAAGSGFLATAFQCAYRCVIQRTDANSNVLFGYPSTRLVVYNTGGSSKNVDLTLYLPSEVTTMDVIQFYRTEQVSGTTSDASGDEMALVYQVSPTSTDISNGYLTFTDSIVDALRGASLYTSPSQEGIGQSNDRPPLCKDISIHKSAYTLYANTSTKQRLFITLVGTASLASAATTGNITSGSNQLTTLGATTGIVVGMAISGTGIPAGTTVSSLVGSTVTMSANATATTVGVSVTFRHFLTLSGTNFYFSGSELSSGAGSPQIAVGSTGVAAADIDSTARSMVRVINRYTSNTTVYAYYLSGPDDLPGKILIEEKGIGASTFTVQSSDSTAGMMFFPPPPASPSTNTQSTSTNSVQKNAVFYSKSQQPEHVPALNYLLVGPANTEILRIVALRDSTIIIKEEGVYRMTGDTPSSFNIVPLDLTVQCKSPNSVSLLSNQVFMLSNQGVVAISDTGVQVVSREIEPSLIPILSYTNLSAYTTGTNYESERSYFLSTMASNADTAPTQTFVFNTFTKTWTRWSFGITAAIVESSTDKMYLCKSSDAKVYRERKSFDESDFADADVAITITAILGSTVTFNVSGSTPLEGWAIFQGSSTIAIDTVVDNGAGSFTVIMAIPPPASWTTGAATLLPSVGFTIVWDAWTAQQPGMMKHVRLIEILTDNITGNNNTSNLIATFITDTDGNTEEVPIDSPAYRWGSMPWGSTPWGGINDTFAYPTWLPRNKQYLRVLNLGVKHKRANEKISINGASFTFEMISERVNK